MAYLFIKLMITTVLIVIISEISKHNSFVGAIFASIPIVSVLALFWLYIETKDISKISSLSTNIFWLVIPSLTLFASLPILLKHGINFYLSMFVSIVLTIGSYFVMTQLLTYYANRA